MVNGVDLGIKDQDGFTAAELAEYNGHSQCAKYLRTVENMVLFDAALTKDQTFRFLGFFFKLKGIKMLTSYNQTKEIRATFKKKYSFLCRKQLQGAT